MRTILLFAMILVAACQQAPGALEPSEVANLLHYERTGRGEPVIFHTDTSVEIANRQLDLFRDFELLFEALSEGGAGKNCK